MGLVGTLRERGFLYQITDEGGLNRAEAEGPIIGYIGFDPTADSLHVGSLVPIMALVHMQREGHTPIALLGGGTAMVGDPSGKTEMRKMLLKEQIEANGKKIKRQLGRYLDFEGGRAIFLNNADWLLPLNYVDFLREIGRHFSVNRMLTAESIKQRLESGLSFLEFNYMLLQAYDFYRLYVDHGCRLQMGGQDQWGNIVAGIDLIRRMTGGTAFGVTFPLLTNASGEKFGKTVAGAVWLDAEKTSPYDFYQFWRNT
ncbi:MAG: tyrosine--tRNA ligase, partial [Deltaproteobacteria bacterium]|nr:tyrosine--tRNA ligase [Deltaproteobacteria bacterium]